MKVLFSLFLSILLSSFAQDSLYKYLKLSNNQVIFQNVYTVDTLSSSEIENLLTSRIPKVKNLTDYRKFDNTITARIENADIDLSAYGVSIWSNYDSLISHPFYCDVSIEWKEGRYRVTLSSIVFKVDGLGEIDATNAYCKSFKKGDKEWSTSKVRVKGGRLLETYLKDLFALESNGDDW